jgi:hypothetical protein
MIFLEKNKKGPKKTKKNRLYTDGAGTTDGRFR